MAGQENRMDWEAYVDASSMEEFFTMMEQRMNSMEGTVEDGFGAMDDAVRETGRLAPLLAGFYVQAFNMIFQAAQKALGSVKQFLENSKQIAMRNQVLGTTLNLVGQRAGYSAQQIQKYEEDVKGLGITTQAARQSLLQMAQANLDWAEASKLARIAQDAAIIAGINSSQAFQRLVTAIQKGEPELLDELGITVSRIKAYQKMAKALGVTTDELTNAQRQQAFLNEIYKQSEVIAGTYEAAMGDVGKQVTSLDRLMEELMDSVGQIFLESESAKVAFYTETLEKLQGWFEKNEETIKAWGHAIGQVTKWLYELLSNVLTFIISLPGHIKNAGIELAVAWNKISGEAFGKEEEVRERAKNIGTYFKQALSIVITAVANAIIGIYKVLEHAALGVEEFWNFLTGKISWDEFTNIMDEAQGKIAGQWIDSVRNVNAAVNDALGLIEIAADNTTEAIDTIAVAADDAEDEIDKLGEALWEVGQMMDDFIEKLEEEAEVRAIREVRKEIERALQESFKVEDIERKHLDRLLQIRESFEEDQIELQESYDEDSIKIREDYADRLISIERRYQQRLRDIQEDFEYEATELARRRDAVGLLALERRKDRELEKADQARDEERRQADKAYAEALLAIDASLAEQEGKLDESLAEQLLSAEESRQKEYDALARSLDRQKQIRELHAQWEEEDRERQLKNKLDDMGEHFAELEGITAEGLRMQLAQYEDSFGIKGAINIVMAGFFERQRELAERTAASMTAMWAPFSLPGMGTSLPPGPWASGFVTDYSSPNAPGGYRPRGGRGANVPLRPRGSRYDPVGSPNRRERDVWEALEISGGNQGFPAQQGGGTRRAWWEFLFGSSGGTLFGQAGQVSSMLSGTSPLVTQQVPRLPAVAPVSSTNRREIHVTADLRGIDPHLQRVVLNTMLEIERNRG